MDPIELEYDSAENIPQGFESLYEENNDGKMVLTKVKGMKTDADVGKVQESLRKERADHKETKNKLNKFGELDADDVNAKLEKLAELEAGEGGKNDDETIEKRVQARLAQHTGPKDREIERLKKEMGEVTEERDTLSTKIERKNLSEAVRGEAQKMGIHSTAIPDVEMVAMNHLEKDDNGKYITTENSGLTPGLDVSGFLKEMQQSRPHWWPDNKGGGAGGGSGAPGGQNPFTNANWSLTKQGEFINTHGMDAAQKAAKAAGTTVGGQKPAAS